MATINGVTGSIPFKGEDRHESGGIGVGVPLLGAGIGVGVNAIMNKGFSTLPAVEKFSKEDRDTFIKASESFTGETKTNAAPITDYFKKLDAEEAKSGGTSGEQKPAVATEPAKTEPAKTEPAKAEPAKAEVAAAKPEVTGLTTEQYMKKYGYGTNLDSLSAQEKALREGTIPDAEKELKKAGERLQQVEHYTSIKQEMKSLEEEIAKIEAEVKIAQAKADASGAMERINKQAARDLEPRNQRLSILDETAKKLERDIRLTDANGIPTPVEFNKTPSAIDAEWLKQHYEPGGPKEKELTEKVFDEIYQKHLGTLPPKSDGKPYDRNDYTAIRNDLRTSSKKEVETLVAEKMKAAKDKIELAVVTDQEATHYVKINELAQSRVTTLEKELEGHRAKLEKIGQDIELVSNAEKSGARITPDGKLVEAPKPATAAAPAAAEAPKTTPVTAEAPKTAPVAADAKPATENADAAKKALEDLKKPAQEAFDKIKGNLGEEVTKALKKFNWKGLGIGAGIGLVAGIAAKLIFGGKSEEA